MLCPKCGSYVDVGARSCPVCGTKVSTETINDATPAARRRTPARPATDMPMKWFNFLIYFALWVGGIMTILMSSAYFSGFMYQTGEITAQLVYEAFPQVKTIDTVYGFALIACGAFTIYTRFRLAGFKPDGPRCLYISYAVTATASLVYEILIANVIGDPSIVNGTVTSVAVTVLIIIFNRVYFQRRAELFEN